MAKETTLDVLLKLASIVKNEVKPFPYDDIRKLTEAGIDVGSLVPDLSMYCAAIWGFCSWGRKAFRWESEGWPREKVEAILAKTFYEEYPHYSFLEKEINDRKLNGLKTEIEETERMRQTLLGILDDIYSPGKE